jgi:hypothetical protein
MDTASNYHASARPSTRRYGILTPLNFSVPPELATALREASRRTLVPQAVILRRAVRRELAEMERGDRG